MRLIVLLVTALIRLGGWLPLAFVHAQGRALARVLALLGTHESKVARTNVKLCFPELDEPAADQFLRQTLAETGMSTLELRLSKLKLGYRRSRGEDERPLLARLALHAYRIRLASPATGAAVTCTAPLPKDLRSTLRQLQKSAGTRVVADLEARLAEPLAAAPGAPDDDPFAPLEPQARAALSREEPDADAD